MKKIMISICIFIATFILIHTDSNADIIDKPTQSENISDINNSYENGLENAKNVFFSYHKDPANFEKAIYILNDLIEAEPDNVEAMIFLSRVWLTFGHYIEGESSEKLERFENGSKIAEKAIELSPTNPNTYFYYAVNEASLLKSKGKFSSFFLISKIKDRLDKVLELDPDHTEAMAMKGVILYSIPGVMGGDIKESEKLIREALVMDPHLTSTKIFLAKNLYKQKHYEEAKIVLVEVLNERYPKVEADWYLNKRVALRMIKQINEIKQKQS